MEKPFFIPVEESIEYYRHIPPPEGFEVHDNFPDCCDWHKSCKREFERWFEEFPNCCDYHRKMTKSSFGFDKSKYETAVEILLERVSYTEHILRTKMEVEDWYDDITDYFEYCFESFGNPSVGANEYHNAVCHFIDKFDVVPNEKKKPLISYFDRYKSSNKTEDVELPDFSKLFSMYERWVKSFPFELSYFKHYEQYFKTQWPLLDGKPKFNRYSGIGTSKLITKGKLIQTLQEQTKMLLKAVGSHSIDHKGELEKYKQDRLIVASERYRIEQDYLLNSFEKGERKYLNTIKKWLRYTQDYFKELEAIEKLELPKPEPTKGNILEDRLSKYGFFELPSVKRLFESQRKGLIEILASKKLPYQIAMLDYLGFLRYMSNNYVKSNVVLYNKIGKILNANERVVKGNHLVLNPISNESRTKYTAHLHKETVEKDYKNLK